VSATIELPHDVTPHPITGMYNGKFGVWLFLASEVMLFGALFSTYVLLRVGNPEWKHGWDLGLNIPLATLNTMILITSSVTVVMAWYSLQINKFDTARLYLWATVALALGFMVVKYFEYTAKFSHGITPKSNLFFAIYFTMTGLHGLHVLGGVVVFLYLVGPGSRMWLTHPEKYTNRIECTGLYWHFVDLVWIFLFPSLYLL